MTLFTRNPPVLPPEYKAEDYLPDDYVPNSEPLFETYKRAAERLLKPIPSIRIKNMPILDKITGGFRANEYTVLCGATGTGKTTLLANWSAGLFEGSVPHYVASVENGRDDYMCRIMSAQMKEDWNTGDPIPPEKVKVHFGRYGHLIRNKEKPLLWYSKHENRFPVETLMADIDYHRKHHDCKIAFVDNLNFFMDMQRKSDPNMEIDRVTHELIIFCKAIDVHIVMVMHPKKTDHGRVESEFDVKGSSSAVQEAQNVILFNRPSEEMIKNGDAGWFDREIKISKMRRRGRAVGARLILNCNDGVSYQEGRIFGKTNAVNGNHKQDRSRDTD